ncbi:DUF3830 family protein [Sphingosinicella sp. CPCC 101087]|uniref:DUF3830 family protein n=1 Tax=Sphingosinicella sp. CPCC 101087 TaxID=2497754 RepID=UPI00101BD612|nr:DUF3830 family protein [Sphingosinicella sp. CPCC 101087]
MTLIRISEVVSGLDARCTLLEKEAPASCAFLLELASRRATFEAMHAVWTGPELSVPMPSDLLPTDMPRPEIRAENATSFPSSGDVVLAYLPAGSTQGLPPGDFYDVGIFYGSGGRLLMPFGWIQANVCARIVDEDLAKAQADLRMIRRNGVCQITFEAA